MRTIYENEGRMVDTCDVCGREMSVGITGLCMSTSGVSDSMMLLSQDDHAFVCNSCLAMTFGKYCRIGVEYSNKVNSKPCLTVKHSFRGA